MKINMDETKLIDVAKNELNAKLKLCTKKVLLVLLKV